MKLQASKLGRQRKAQMTFSINLYLKYKRDYFSLRMAQLPNNMYYESDNLLKLMLNAQRPDA